MILIDEPGFEIGIDEKAVAETGGQLRVLDLEPPPAGEKPRGLEGAAGRQAVGPERDGPVIGDRLDEAEVKDGLRGVGRAAERIAEEMTPVADGKVGRSPVGPGDGGEPGQEDKDAGERNGSAHRGPEVPLHVFSLTR